MSMFCLCMNSISNYNVNFTSTPIKPVRLKRIGCDSHVYCVLSKLDPDCEEDKNAVKIIKENWSKKFQEDYNTTDCILKGFSSDFSKTFHQKNSSFYAIEIPEKEKLEHKIVGLMELEKEKFLFRKTMNLRFLVTHPDFANQNPNRHIKGIGETLFTEAVKITKAVKASALKFFSSNNVFYFTVLKKANIDDYAVCPKRKLYDNYGHFTLKKKHINEYLNRHD